MWGSDFGCIIWEFPKIGGTFLQVPIIGTSTLGAIMGAPILTTTHMFHDQGMKICFPALG